MMYQRVKHMYGIIIIMKYLKCKPLSNMHSNFEMVPVCIPSDGVFEC